MGPSLCLLAATAAASASKPVPPTPLTAWTRIPPAVFCLGLALLYLTFPLLRRCSSYFHNRGGDGGPRRHRHEASNDAAWRRPRRWLADCCCCCCCYLSLAAGCCGWRGRGESFEPASSLSLASRVPRLGRAFCSLARAGSCPCPPAVGPRSAIPPISLPPLPTSSPKHPQTLFLVCLPFVPTPESPAPGHWKA